MGDSLELKLKVGYFEGWAGGPIILFSGSKKVIGKLEKVFKDLSKSTIREVDIETLEFIDAIQGIKIKACIAKKTPGFLKTFGFTYSLGLRESGDKNQFIWTLEDWEWVNNAGLLSEFESEKPCHQYLNVTNSGTFGVIVSCNEYSDQWWEEFAG